VRFVFGEHHLDTERRELRRGDSPVAVEPQVFDLLLCLLKNRDRAVSKDDLLAQVWRGRVVADATIDSRIKSARRAIGDNGSTQKLIRTFARKGVRFVATVDENHAEIAQSPGQPTVSYQVFYPRKLSIAVLPFQNLTGDPQQDDFIEGIVEEITTALSRLRWLLVIGRNSNVTFQGKLVDVKQMMRELGVRYVLDGSVRKTREWVRITTHMTELISGGRLWAERFNGRPGDILDFQDQVAGGVIGAVEPKLRQSEIERATRKPTETLDAYDLYLHALALRNEDGSLQPLARRNEHTDENIRQAITLLKRALSIDLGYAPAAAAIGWCRIHQLSHGRSPVSFAKATEAAALARQALEIGRDDPDTLWMAALSLHIFAGEQATAAAAVDRSLALNPYSAHAWMARGFISQAQPGLAIEAFEQAMRLSPLDRYNRVFTTGIATAHLVAGRYEEALEWAERSLHSSLGYSGALRVKAIACVHLGHLEQAREVMGQLLALQPWQTLARAEAYARRIYGPEIAARLVDSQRRAGMPSG